MGRVKQLLIEMDDDPIGASIAEALNIEHWDLIQQNYTLHEEPNEDGLYYIEFSPETSHDLLSKIDRLEDDLKVYLDPSEIYNFDNYYWEKEFDFISDKKEFYQTFIIKPYIKLR